MKKKKISTAQLNTELGFKIEVLKCQRIGEEIAKMKEESEDRKFKIERRMKDLLTQMREDKINHFSAKAPGGTLYRFDVVSSDTKVKITKPA